MADTGNLVRLASRGDGAGNESLIDRRYRGMVCGIIGPPGGMPMGMLRRLLSTLAVFSGLTATIAMNDAAAQGFDASGNWSCSVTLYEAGLQPYGYQAEISAQRDGGLYAQGAVYNPNLQNSVVPFQARGDWAVFNDANGFYVRLRAHTQSHGILVFEGYATSQNTIYLRTGLNGGGQAEAQCNRTR